MLYCSNDEVGITGWKLVDLDSIRRKAAQDEEWVFRLPVRTAPDGERFRIVDLDALTNPIVASGSKCKTTTVEDDDDDDFITTTITKTTTIRRRKSEAAFQAAG